MLPSEQVGSFERPVVPPEVTLPEITPKAVLLSVILAAVLAAANAYLGLFAGMTVSASIPAAVVSMAVLRLFARSNILENNIVQTAASSGEAVAAGVIFTIPALLLIGYWSVFNYWETAAISAVGGLLGVLFTIPLRRALIVQARLRYPEGVATAEVLKVGSVGQAKENASPSQRNDPARGVRLLLGAAVLGGLVKFGESGMRLWSEALEGGLRLGRSVMYGGINLSPALLAVGFIVGFETAVVVFGGGALSAFILTPILGAMQGISGNLPPLEAARSLWSGQIRFVGIGAMLVGGVWTLFKLRGTMLEGLRHSVGSGGGSSRTGPPPVIIGSGGGSSRTGPPPVIIGSGGGSSRVPALRVEGPTPVLKGVRKPAVSRLDKSAEYPLLRTERDAPWPWVIIPFVLTLVPMALIYTHVVGDPIVAVLMTVIMAGTGFLFSAVAGYMAGIVGSSSNPVSGVTIATIAFSAALLILLMGRDYAAGPAAALMIGAVVCCAAAMGGDNLQDLKTGHIVGATPWKQQIMQVVGVATAACVIAPVLTLLQAKYGLGEVTAQHPHPLTAPQATLMASLAKGVFGGTLPWGLVGLGGAIGALVIVIDQRQEHAGKAFRVPVLAFALGMYLPLKLSAAVLLGGVISGLVHRRWTSEASAANQTGLLCAAGLVTGEALMGIALAVPIALSSVWPALSADPFLLFQTPPLGGWPGLLMIVLVGIWLYKNATRPVLITRNLE